MVGIRAGVVIEADVVRFTPEAGALATNPGEDWHKKEEHTLWNLIAVELIVY